MAIGTVEMEVCFLVHHLTSHSHVIISLCNFMGETSLMISYTPATFGGDRHRGSLDIMV